MQIYLSQNLERISELSWNGYEIVNLCLKKQTLAISDLSHAVNISLELTSYDGIIIEAYSRNEPSSNHQVVADEMNKHVSSSWYQIVGAKYSAIIENINQQVYISNNVNNKECEVYFFCKAYNKVLTTDPSLFFASGVKCCTQKRFNLLAPTLIYVKKSKIRKLEIYHSY